MWKPRSFIHNLLFFLNQNISELNILQISLNFFYTFTKKQLKFKSTFYAMTVDDVPEITDLLRTDLLRTDLLRTDLLK